MEDNLKELNFPEKYRFQMKMISNRAHIFCPIRRGYYFLTPEEWVRQHWVQFLLNSQKLPKHALVLEHKVEWNGQWKRADILVYKGTKPHILLECKKAGLALNQAHIDQLSMYNIKLNAEYLILSNGQTHNSLKKEGDSYQIIEDVFQKYVS